MEKMSPHDFGLDRTMANVELVRAIFIYYNIIVVYENGSDLYVQVSSGLNHYFFSFRVHRETDRHTEKQTDRHTDDQTDRQTDGHEYSIVAVDKPQL